MITLGLEPHFFQSLIALERANPPVDVTGGSSLRIIQRDDALRALSVFSAHVHIWYPIFRPGFSDYYLRTISGPLEPGPDSCLVLLVAEVGTLVQNNSSSAASSAMSSSGLYLEAAMASLPKLLLDTSITAVQCLILLSIYYCCRLKPCQAYEYIMMASFKVQNLLKTADAGDNEDYEQLKRAYWAVLLLESELQDQLDAVRSGIWDHDEQTALPDDRSSWLFDDVLQASPVELACLAAGENNQSSAAQAYFLAEIAIRRMLHRCNTAVRTTPEGTFVYASGVAIELQRQLDEWYDYLPDIIRFDDDPLLDFDVTESPRAFPSLEPLSNFLRVQYYCCKLSIYWPAVYQCIQDGVTTPDTKEHAERFFTAYIQLIPALLTAAQSCIVNRWTLCTTAFMTTMAALQGAKTPCLRDNCDLDWQRLWNCLRSARSVSRGARESSPSLTIVDGILAQRLDGE